MKASPETIPPATTAKVTLLGTGTSTGIPVIGCSCRVCRSNDPRDQRLRCSCFVQINGINVLIDAGPDFRTQAIRAEIDRIDAVLVTHHHFDHIGGLDDLRPFFFNNRAPIPCYAHPETAASLRSRYPYIFGKRTYPGVANLELHEIDKPFHVRSRYHDAETACVIPLEVFHGRMLVLGFRLGNFAYITDTNRIPRASMTLLEGIHTLVLDALRHEPHPSHFSIAEATEITRAINPAQTYFTHMTHGLLHAEEDEQLPGDIALAYDGLQFEVPA